MVGRVALVIFALLATAVAIKPRPATLPAPKPGYTFQADSPVARMIVETTVRESILPVGDQVVRVRKATKTRLTKTTIDYADEMDLVQAIRGFEDGAYRAPSIPSRGVLVDVARRYHSISTLRTLSRWCSEANVPVLLLHLTDDQNWMFPSEVVKGTDEGNTHKKPAYTKAELQELIDFARLRGVTVVPEIDMPGHNRLLVRHRPDLKLAGTSNVVDITSPQVRKTMKALITEVASLFKDSPYIHLGGDEVDHGGRERAYVDFLGEMADAVIVEGKKPIIWEGFSQSEFAKSRIPKEALVVAWEGPYYPASKLVGDGFQTLNAGWDPYYVVNHYPYESFTLVPVERILNHNPRKFGVVDWAGPRDRSFDFPDSDLLKGSLMCWWEGHEWNTSRILPARILAMGDRLAKPKGWIGYEGWLKRYEEIEKRIDRLAHPFEIICSSPQFERSVSITLRPRMSGVKPAYRLDGETPKQTDANKPSRFTVSDSAVLSVLAFREGKAVGEVKWLPLHRVQRVAHLALGAKVETDGGGDPHFGPELAVDGVADVLGSFWLAYPAPRQLKIDLGSAKTVGRIEVFAFWAANAAARYRLETSLDGKAWTIAADSIYQSAPSTPEGYRHTFAPREARYVRLETRLGDGFPPRIARINEVRVFEK